MKVKFQKTLKAFIPTILWFTIFSSGLYAQFYTTGVANPLKPYNEIKTEHFKVVFQANFEKEANRLANLLEYAYALAKADMNFELKKKVSVLLHSGTAYSNGFVSIAPYRSEINAIAPQRSYSQEWLQHVTIHEMQHVIQLGKLHEGVFGLFKVLTGQGITGITAGFFPIWAYEGDAVVAETMLTKAGRGRSPSFLMDMKALSLENNKFTYEKAYFGSMNDHVPSYYAYGYAMSAMARIKYDPHFWKNVLEYIPKKQFTLYPSYFSIKKKYGISKKDLFDQTMTYLHDYWKKNDTGHTEYQVMNKQVQKEYTDYLYPVVMENGDIICLKKQNAAIARIIKLDKKGEEEVLAIPGLHTIERLSYGGGKLVWNEIRQHPVWEKEEESYIRVLDLGTDKKQKIGKGSIYEVAAINQQGSKIVAVEKGLPGKNNLVIFDITSGKTEHSISFDHEIQMPSWHPLGHKIVFTGISTNGKSIYELDISSLNVRSIFGPVHYDLSSVTYFNQSILFSSAMNNKDEIYAYQYENGKLFCISSSRYGAFDPVFDANYNAIIFNNYTSQGYAICSFSVDDIHYQLIDNTNSRQETVFVDELIKSQKQFIHPDEIPQKTYTASTYSRLKNMVNIHSWIPFYAVPLPDDLFHGGIYPGVTVFSQNLTERLYGYAGYAYKKGVHSGNLNITYRGLWPVIQLNYEMGGIPEVIPHPDAENPVAPSENNRQQLNLGIRQPLFYNLGPALIHLLPGAEYVYEDDYNYNEGSGLYQKGLHNFQYFFNFSIASKRAVKDLYPRLGFYARARYYDTPFESNYGTMVNLVTRLYLPGFFPNHSLRFTLSEQHQERGALRYPYSLQFPRGHAAYLNDALHMVSGEYSMPLFYPDWTLGPLLYIKRFSASLFYDQAFAEGLFTGVKQKPYVDEFYKSTGIELTADFHVAHVFVPLEAGVRIIYLPQTGKTIVEPVVSFNISEF